MRIHYYILIDLGKGKINWMQAGFAYDLISPMDVAGGTHSRLLAANEYYRKAVKDWVNCQKAKRQRLMESQGMEVNHE